MAPAFDMSDELPFTAKQTWWTVSAEGTLTVKSIVARPWTVWDAGVVSAMAKEPEAPAVRGPTTSPAILSTPTPTALPNVRHHFAMRPTLVPESGAVCARW